jgi:hypothetical protein
MSNFNSTMISEQDSLMLQGSSTISQSVTIATGDTAVTLTNPHKVENAETSTKSYYIKLSGESTFAKYVFTAGQVKNMKASSIGGTTTGSDAGSVVVRGIK